ncbi:unnamed protein product, partial [Iphiclides podalirius]
MPGRKHACLVFHGYTYKRYQILANGQVKWRCSKWHSGCRVSVKTNTEDPRAGIVLIENLHNHERPRLIRNSDGFLEKANRIRIDRKEISFDGLQWLRLQTRKDQQHGEDLLEVLDDPQRLYGVLFGRQRRDHTEEQPQPRRTKVQDAIGPMDHAIVHLLPSGRGKHPLLMFNKYTFRRQYALTTGALLWYCSNRHSGCKAFMHSVDSAYTYGDKEHNHPPPHYVRHDDGTWIKIGGPFFVPSKRKNSLLMFEQYTFRKKNKLASGWILWYCSDRHNGCNAKLHSCEDAYSFGDDEHNHPPPRCEDAYYFDDDEYNHPQYEKREGIWIKMKATKYPIFCLGNGGTRCWCTKTTHSGRRQSLLLAGHCGTVLTDTTAAGLTSTAVTIVTPSATKSTITPHLNTRGVQTARGLVHLLPTHAGKHPLLMFDGYTFKRQTQFASGKVLWYCSNRRNGCKACVNSVGDEYTLRCAEHNHPPPRYMRGSDGSWIKINWVER